MRKNLQETAGDPNYFLRRKRIRSMGYENFYTFMHCLLLSVLTFTVAFLLVAVMRAYQDPTWAGRWVRDFNIARTR